MATSSISGSAAVVTQSETSASPTKAIASDYETFLKMLTVQMQNQDPLNPVDASDYAAQLAAFSTVEQQVLTNDLLASIETRLASSDFANLAGWVGLQARSENPALFSGTPVTSEGSPEIGADSAELVVKNESDTEIFRAAVSLSDDTYQWSGETLAGTLAAHGRYSFFIESYSNGASLGTRQLQTYGRVTEAQLDGDEVILVLEGGISVPADSVSALRSPE